MPDIVSELRWRELIHQTTDNANLQAWLNEKPRTIYVGFDPTSDSMHVGNLVAVMLLRRFQQAGHRPIALVGGATGMIGDPSGKSEERNLLNVDVLRANVASLEKQLRRFLDFDCGANSALLVNNYDWMGTLRLPRISPRHRQAFSGECHAGERLGQGAARTDRLPA